MEGRLLTAQSAKDKLCPYEEYLARYVNQVPSFAKIPFENETRKTRQAELLLSVS